MVYSKPCKDTLHCTCMYSHQCTPPLHTHISHKNFNSSHRLEFKVQDFLAMIAREYFTIRVQCWTSVSHWNALFVTLGHSKLLAARELALTCQQVHWDTWRSTSGFGLGEWAPPPPPPKCCWWVWNMYFESLLLVKCFVDFMTSYVVQWCG